MLKHLQSIRYFQNTRRGGGGKINRPGQLAPSPDIFSINVNDQETMVVLRGVFQKYAERFHRLFAIAARLMIFHCKHAWYMLIKYR